MSSYYVTETSARLYMISHSILQQLSEIVTLFKSHVAHEDTVAKSHEACSWPHSSVVSVSKYFEHMLATAEPVMSTSG